VSNLLRLLEAAPEVCEMVAQHSLEMGHARALLGLTNKRKQAEIAAVVAKKGMSVRETEALVRRLTAAPAGGSSGSGESAAANSSAGDPNVSRLEQELADKLGAKVTIEHGASGKGKVVVAYNSLDELDGILAHIQ
jgi:ParB family chromosome partitioning protein